MKRKILVLVFAFVAVFACVFGITACRTRSDGVDGTYYLYENGTYDKSQYIKLEGKNWSDDDNSSGTYTINGTAIVFYANVFGSNEEMFSGTLSDGVLTLNIFGADWVYCKEGSAPSGNTPNVPDKPSAKKYTVTYDANGGKFADGTVTVTQTADGGSTLTAPASPMRTSYAFGGWSTTANGGTLWKFASDTVTEDTVLYAVWEEQSAVIISADGANIDEKLMEVFMLVDSDTDSVSLSNKIVCSSDSIWRLYYDKLGLTEIPTKIAVQKSGELNDGDNVFYIVVTSQNGSQVNTYKLTVHRSYRVTVNYYSNKNTLLEQDYIYTGYEYTSDYVPDIAGYTFNFWKDENGKKVTRITPYTSLDFYADCTALPYTVSYDANGGNGSLSKFDIVSGQSFTVNSGSAFYRDNYTLLEFNTRADGIGTKIELGSTINDYSFAEDITLYAIWQSYFSFTSYNNKLTITGLNIDNCINLSIPNAIEDKAVVEIAAEAFKDHTEIKTATIPDSVTVIGEGAFNGCSGLISMTLPFVGASSSASISPLGYIFGTNSYDGGNGTIQQSGQVIITFYIPYNLKNITITANNIGARAFFNCSGLTSVTIGNGVTKIGVGAFEDCTSLTSVTIPDSVTTIGTSAFYRCRRLKSVIIPDSVPSIGSSTFEDCTSLTSVTIPDSVTSIGEKAFYGCSSLTSITIPNSVTFIGSSAFEDCTSLTSVTISDSVTSIGYCVFRACTSLTSITIPDSVTSIVDWAFYGCSSLTSITIPDSVTSIGERAFNGCSGLTSVTFKNTSGWWFSNASNATSGTSISSIDLANTTMAAKYLTSTYRNYYWKRS